MKRALLFSFLLSPLALAHEGDHPAPAGTVAEGVVRTGNGAYSFDTVPGWGTLPDGKNVGPTHGGVAVSEDGRVFVSTDAEHGIVQFGPDGKFQKFLEPTIRVLHSLQIVKEGDTEYLIAAHLKGNRVVKMTLDGEVVLQIPNSKTGLIPGEGTRGEGDKKRSVLGRVTAAAVAPNGDIYAACGYGSNQVHRFDSEGVYKATFGGKEEEGKSRTEYKFRTPHGLSIDTRFGEPRLLVVDREQGRLVHYTLDFKYIGEYATNLRRPCAVDFHGDLCVVAELAGRVTIVDKSGAPVAFLGDNPNVKQRNNFGVEPKDMKVGVFTAPHGCAFDNDGNVIVQDWNKTGRVTFLKKAE